jgi:carbonic anhydrase
MRYNHKVTFSKIMATTTLLLILGIVAAVNHQVSLAMGQGNNNTATIKEWPNIMPNVKTFVVSNITSPQIDDSAFIHLLQLLSVIAS